MHWPLQPCPSSGQLEARQQRSCPREDTRPHCLVFSPQAMNPLPVDWEEQRSQSSFELHSPMHNSTWCLRWVWGYQEGDIHAETQLPSAPTHGPGFGDGLPKGEGAQLPLSRGKTVAPGRAKHPSTLVLPS